MLRVARYEPALRPFLGSVIILEFFSGRTSDEKRQTWFLRPVDMRYFIYYQPHHLKQEIIAGTQHLVLITTSLSSTSDSTRFSLGFADASEIVHHYSETSEGSLINSTRIRRT